LNRYATVIASNTKYTSERFYHQFWVFVELFIKSNFDESYLQGNYTAVTEAYWSFLKCCDKEVTEIGISD